MVSCPAEPVTPHAVKDSFALHCYQKVCTAPRAPACAAIFAPIAAATRNVPSRTSAACNIEQTCSAGDIVQSKLAI